MVPVKIFRGFYVSRDFSGSPVVKILCFHQQGLGFDPGLGN